MNIRRLLMTTVMLLVPIQTVPQAAKIDPVLLKKANGGDAQSQYLLGQAYASGKGVQQDDGQAAQCTRRQPSRDLQMPSSNSR